VRESHVEKVGRVQDCEYEVLNVLEFNSSAQAPVRHLPLPRRTHRPLLQAPLVLTSPSGPCAPVP